MNSKNKFMKTMTRLKIVVLVSFLGVTAFAQTIPPPNPGPPGFGVSDHLWLLGIIALGFGFYKINSINLNKN
jgi:hypothetical protein